MLLLLPLCASAQTVYKCKDAKGGSVYQSSPCAGAVPAEKQWSGIYRQPTSEELWQRHRTEQRWTQRQQAGQARRGANSYHVVPSSGDSRSNRDALTCTSVRQEYDRVQADFKLNRNIDLLRRLEADIRRYCEVRP